LWAALAYGAGIVAGASAWRPPLWWVIAAVGFLGAGGYFVRRRLWLGFFLALGSLFFIGALEIQLRTAQGPLDDGVLVFADGGEVVVTAHVTHEGEIREADFGGLRQSVGVETESVTSGTKTLAVRAGLRLGIYGKESDQEYDNSGEPVPMRIFRYGERLRFPAKLRPPRNFRNPGAFDYRGYLADQGIVVLASTKSSKVEELPGFVGSRVELWRERAHRSIVRKIHALWAVDDAALMDAAVIGESAFLTAGTRVDFQRSGTYHILVVSGMNVSILAFVVFWVMRRSRLSDFLASLLTAILCTAYAFVTDVGPPVWRAVLMLVVYLGVRLLCRGRSMLNALGAAALSVMVADPKSLLGASFQLTFLSVFILGAIAAPVLDRTSQPYLRGLRHLDSPDFDRTLPPPVAQMRLDLRLIAGRLAQFLGGRTSLAILAGTARGTLSAYELLLGVCTHAGGTGASHGLLLSPGHRDGNSGERAGGAPDGHPDAGGRASCDLELCVATARQNSRTCGGGVAAWDYRHGAWAGRTAHGRSSRGGVPRWPRADSRCWRLRGCGSAPRFRGRMSGRECSSLPRWTLDRETPFFWFRRRARRCWWTRAVRSGGSNPSSILARTWCRRICGNGGFRGSMW
jgi:competence protein ComEC